MKPIPEEDEDSFTNDTKIYSDHDEQPVCDNDSIDDQESNDQQEGKQIQGQEKESPSFLQYDRFGSPMSNSLFTSQRKEQPRYHDRLSLLLKEFKLT